ncbi:MAG: neutral/alkaline non-lysosomal ceramidase N-terminal domain-containing protein [Polyangia bacterium]
MRRTAQPKNPARPGSTGRTLRGTPTATLTATLRRGLVPLCCGLLLGGAGCTTLPDAVPDGGGDAQDLAAGAPDLGTQAARCEYEAAPVPSGVGQKIAAGPVLAGVGEAALDLPVGTPLGGYTSRMTLLGGEAPDTRKSPHAKAFVPSAGLQTRPQVKALYLKAGDEPVLLLKLDTCVSFDRLVYDLEQAMSSRGLMPARGRVIVATSHTHAGYGTFQGAFHLSLGFDLFQEEQYQRLLKSLVTASEAAIKDAGPARIGAGIWDRWDAADEIYSDRRGEDDGVKGPDGKPVGPHKEQRLLLLRVDRALAADKTEPLALLTSFPMHGTVSDSDNPLVSVEATGHVELALEEKFDKKVLVMHLQGPAGDASPRGRGGLGACDGKRALCTNFARMESIGHLAAPRITSLYAAIPTAKEAALEIVTRTVRNGRDLTVRGGMSYAPYEPGREIDNSPAAIFNPDGTARSPITQFNVPVGAALCGDKTVRLGEGIPGAKGKPYGSCSEIISATEFISTILRVPKPEQPTCEITRTTLSALRLSGVPLVQRKGAPGMPVDAPPVTDSLLLVTMPGEPVSLLAEALAARSPAGPERTFVVGYAQGHIGYILNVENWLLGGYEPSINVFGPLEGEWLMERALDLAKLAMTPERDDAEAAGDAGGPQAGGRFDRLKFLPQKPADLAIAKTDKAGTVPAALPATLFVRTTKSPPLQAQPSPTVPRVAGRATFVFYGGDPEEDTPLVTLQHEEMPGVFVEVQTRSGRALGGRGRDVLLTYTPQPLDAEPGKAQAHLWAAEWQAVGWDRKDKQGLDVVFEAPLGRYRFSVRGTAAGKAYTLQSAPFTVVADGAIAVTGSRTGARLQLSPVYPVGDGFRLLRLETASDGEPAVLGPVGLTLRSKKDGKTEMKSATAAGMPLVVDTALDVSAGIEVTVEDAAGNRGVVTLP